VDGAPAPISVSVGRDNLRPVVRGLSQGVVEAWGLGGYALAEFVDAMLELPEAPPDPVVTVEFQLTWPVLRVRVEAAKSRRVEYLDLAGWLFAEFEEAVAS
jgi:hypothetical protein